MCISVFCYVYKYMCLNISFIFMSINLHLCMCTTWVLGALGRQFWALGFWN